MKYCILNNMQKFSFKLRVFVSKLDEQCRNNSICAPLPPPFFKGIKMIGQNNNNKLDCDF